MKTTIKEQLDNAKKNEISNAKYYYLKQLEKQEKSIKSKNNK